MKSVHGLRVAVTGCMGSGKTWLCERLQDISMNTDAPITVINADKIRAAILEDQRVPLFRETQLNLIEYFGHEIKRPEGGINRRRLADVIFYDKEALRYHDSILDPVLLSTLSKAVRASRGPVLLDWALVLEKKALALTDYNLILLNCEEDIRLARLTGGDLPDAQVRKRFALQHGFEYGRAEAMRVQKDTGKGFLLTLNTSKGLSEESLWSICSLLGLQAVKTVAPELGL